MTDPSPTPTDILRLLWRVDHELGSLSRQMLARLGVTSPQRLVLRALLRAPETTAAGLAEILLVDRSAVTGILQRMESAGLVERAQDTTDGRRQRIRVTPAGIRLDALRHGTVEAALSRALDAMEPREVPAIARFLESFTEELRRESRALAEGES